MGSDNKPAEWKPDTENFTLATFAGGCFWGLELAFQREEGVVETCVGYTAGHVDNPTYRQICSGVTGHAEAVQMVYDPQQVTYNRLCELFFSRINPFVKNRQGNDVGSQYRTGIYYHDDKQRKIAESFMKKDYAVEIKAAGAFWPAEEYHQQYLSKGGRCGSMQSAKKGCNDPIRCYG